jgi:hypothetical protein
MSDVAPIVPNVTDPVPAKWPFALVEIETESYPAIVRDWTRRKDSNGYPHWMAYCFYLVDGEFRQGSIPETRVRKVGG